MKVNKNIIISVIVTLVAGVGISAFVFKPLGTVATEKNNAELYLQMKEEAKEEVKAEFDKQLEEVKKDTNEQIEKLKVEYDKAIADAKLEQANNIQAALEQANTNAQEVINQATSPEVIEERRQEEINKKPIEAPKTEYNEVPPSKED